MTASDSIPIETHHEDMIVRNMVSLQSTAALTFCLFLLFLHMRRGICLSHSKYSTMLNQTTMVNDQQRVPPIGPLKYLMLLTESLKSPRVDKFSRGQYTTCTYTPSFFANILRIKDIPAQSGKQLGHILNMAISQPLALMTARFSSGKSNNIRTQPPGLGRKSKSITFIVPQVCVIYNAYCSYSRLS